MDVDPSFRDLGPRDGLAILVTLEADTAFAVEIGVIAPDIEGLQTESSLGSGVLARDVGIWVIQSSKVAVRDNIRTSGGPYSLGQSTAIVYISETYFGDCLVSQGV